MNWTWGKNAVDDCIVMIKGSRRGGAKVEMAPLVKGKACSSSTSHSNVADTARLKLERDQIFDEVPFSAVV